MNESVAFDIDGSKWPGAETEFWVGMVGISPSGVAWNTAFIDAMNEWSDGTDFNFIVRPQYRNPCADDRVNSVDFTDSVCGSAFGTNTIAVTLRSWEPAILGPPQLSQADIAVNSARQFDIFDGPLPPFFLGSSGNPIDFQRVALHELGHALGLEHDNRNPAIMNSTIGDTSRLQQDDIDGANALYGGLSNCAVALATFGIVDDALQAGDCTVQQLTSGGEDTSFIDVRRLELDSITNLSVEMRSQNLDSVLLLADSRLRIIGLDDNGGDNCDASLSQILSAGTYYLLANTYDEATACGDITGPYQLTVSYSNTGLIGLGGVNSLKGPTPATGFFGGITANDGDSFGNLFRSNDSLDIQGRIQVDPLHQGQAGFLVIGAVIGEDLLLQNEQGQFVGYALGSGPIIKATSKVLQALESIVIVEDLVPAELGVTEVSVDFYMGYGLDENPGELYFHQDPINLVVTP